jgi:hypothetical protein
MLSENCAKYCIAYADDFRTSVQHPVACAIEVTINTVLKLVVCILLRVLGQVQGFRLTQHCFEYFIQ